MNAIKIYTMRIGCSRIFIQTRTLLRSIKPQIPIPNRNLHIPVSRFNQTHKPYFSSSPNWVKSRVFPVTYCSSSSSSSISKQPNYVADYSTTVESRVNDKNFETVYVQGGGGGDLKGDESKNVGNAKILSRTESVAEKEAWRLLREAVVTYCGNPVGTLAANDPGDKMPLNYDQVFIRDFVPSALAFLLKGEGEIVRNFLLHTLQLQVIFQQ